MHSLPLLLALLPALAFAAPNILKTHSRVDRVIVYQGTAKVMRTARVELPAGDVQVLFEHLPLQLLDDSLGIEGSGSAKAKVFGATVEQTTRAEANSPEVHAGEEKVLQLEQLDRVLDDQVRSANERKAFVSSLRATYSQERSQNLPVRAVDAKELTAMADFIVKQTDLVQEQLRKSESQKYELAKQLTAARGELAKLNAKRNVTTKTIAVELRVERAGTFDVGVSYLVAGASWQPAWDARLSAEKGVMELSLSGVVSQTTGEDWADVTLDVSTAQPTRALYVPELGPRYLTKYVPAYGGARPGSASMQGRAAAPAPSMAMEEEGSAADEDAEESHALETPTAQVSQGLLSASFKAPRRETIEGAGKPRKALLAIFPLKAELVRLSAPSIDQQVYLTAKAVNDAGVPIMAGAVNAFLGDEFLGRSSFGHIPLGDEVKLAFGADERIKLERKQVERHHETAGLFTKDEVFKYRYRTTVKNLYPTRVSVTVLEQLPVSRDESIQVKLLDGSTATSEKEDPNKPGVRTYKLDLEPKAEKVIELVYEVRYPRNQAVSGLD